MVSTDLKTLTRPEIREIIRRLCAALEPLFPQGRLEAVVFGSYARGEAEPGSDLDVMILTDASREVIAGRDWEVGGIAGDLSLDYGVVIAPVVENCGFFRRWAEAMPFFRSVCREGIRDDG